MHETPNSVFAVVAEVQLRTFERMKGRVICQRTARAYGEAILTVLAGDEFLVRVTASAAKRLGLKEGTAVFLIIKTRSFSL